jgi:hypothetical protein
LACERHFLSPSLKLARPKFRSHPQFNPLAKAQ